MTFALFSGDVWHSGYFEYSAGVLWHCPDHKASLPLRLGAPTGAGRGRPTELCLLDRCFGCDPGDLTPGKCVHHSQEAQG